MGSGRGKVDKTPSKVKTRVADPALCLRTPDKYGAGISSARIFRVRVLVFLSLRCEFSGLCEPRGIIELTLNRSERRNAIGKDFLRGFKECLEAVSKDSSANVVLIRSLVPNVFCAGADLKVGNKTQFLKLYFDLFRYILT
ncbi:hypothetical protein F8388_016960 [Cannabis sativa]|uniref:Uncharacterized protein n=1 Tax=Cannabis sativa TaxID=3483 RepID=A0A7J6E3W7_CANSA|nr:hypothetical protein F8388_016960 [Cannabis sativa]